jgi:molecular chaperone HscC
MLVGIDLGTTNSAIAVWREGKSELIPNDLGDLLTPSAVSISDDGAILVGLAARERQSTHPKLTATAFKRLMGTKQRAQLGKKSYSPEELSAMVLRSLKADAERVLGEPVTGAVITVPAYFNDRQRKATRMAGELAGLTVERLVNEPTAAALAYGIHELDEEAPFLVFDLGGGTFDVSLVEIFNGIIEVRASAGDNRLGGEDFNEAMAELAARKLALTEAQLKGDREGFRQIMRAAAERTRRTLTDNASATFKIVWNNAAHETEITSDEYEEFVAPLLARLRDPVLRSMRDGKTKSDELREVILVGGATRMPIVRRTVTKMFGRFPNITLHPDHAVALGAAVQAGLKSKDAALSEIRLTDVCPFTLGTEISERTGSNNFRNGIFSPIIERNTVIPTSRVNSYYTLQDNQKEVTFPVYQGEARDVADNLKLGEITIKVPPGKAGTFAIECRFSYDASGLLEVDVSIPSTGVANQLVICDDEERVTPAEMDKRRAALAGLKIHPRDEAANAATLARADRCYQNFLGEERDYIGSLLSQFQTVLEAQDPRDIEAARTDIEARLNEIEGDRFL